jgi:hypothetical protein
VRHLVLADGHADRIELGDGRADCYADAVRLRQRLVDG